LDKGPAGLLLYVGNRPGGPAQPRSP
jgi:hypothetical protein